MADAQKSKRRLEIAHVLFIDIVGYSKLRINEQTAQVEKLREIVRGTEQFRAADAEGNLLRLPTGDGGALAFRNSPEAPAICAEEIARALQNHPEIRVRMGIHSGPVNEVTDLNEQANIAGAGINVAQRVMDCGDAGHILVSKHAAEDLAQSRQWRPYLHDLGVCTVKHGAPIHVANFYAADCGNSQWPEKFKQSKRRKILKLGTLTKNWSSIAAALVATAVFAVVVSYILHRPSSKATNAAVSISLAAPLPEKSIAVLPFENMSDKKENAYFADGVQDEILTNLAKIRDLWVISRTSVMQYKSGAPSNEIGRA